MNKRITTSELHTTHTQSNTMKRFLKYKIAILLGVLVILNTIPSWANYDSFEGNKSLEFLQYLGAAQPVADFQSESVEMNMALTGHISITLTSQEVLWVDANKCAAEGAKAAWLSFDITNTLGSDLTNVVVVFGGFTNELDFDTDPFDWLEDPQDDTRIFNTLAAGETVPVYFYADYSALCTYVLSGGEKLEDFTADYILTVSSDSQPDEVRSSSVSNNTLLTTSAGGLLSSTTLGPGIYVGQILTQTTTYSFGNNTRSLFSTSRRSRFS